MEYEKNKPNPTTEYREKKIGKTLYRVTSVYKNEFELVTALEDLIVKKILREENYPSEKDSSEC